ncbi:hypothetical protein ACIPF8_18870 [Collimonas sp. NPDC087041]
MTTWLVIRLHSLQFDINPLFKSTPQITVFNLFTENIGETLRIFEPL